MRAGSGVGVGATGRRGAAMPANPLGSIRQLVFHSRAQHALTQPEIEAMAARAAARNQALGITGRLYQVGREFIQVSEGPAEPVGRLYVNIAFDSRHAEVTTRLDRWGGGRNYTGWALHRAPDWAVLRPAAPPPLADFIGPPAPLPAPPLASFASDLEYGDLRQPPIQARARESLMRLIDCAEGALARDGAIGRLTLADIAREAKLAYPSAYRYVPNLDALIRMGVRRRQDGMNQRFLAFMRDRDFPDAAALAEAAVDFTIARALMPTPLGKALVFKVLLRRFHQVRPEAALAIAERIIGALPPGSAGRAIGAPRLMAGLLAMGTVVRAICLENAEDLRRPATRALLLGVMLGALQAPGATAPECSAPA